MIVGNSSFLLLPFHCYIFLFWAKFENKDRWKRREKNTKDKKKTEYERKSTMQTMRQWCDDGGNETNVAISFSFREHFSLYLSCCQITLLALVQLQCIFFFLYNYSLLFIAIDFQIHFNSCSANFKLVEMCRVIQSKLLRVIDVNEHFIDGQCGKF